MPLADLVRALEHDAAAQVDALLVAARARAAGLEQAALRDRDDQLARAAGTYREACQARADERVALVQQRTRAELLAARAAMLERVRAALLVLLPSYTARVADALDRAARSCAGDSVRSERRVATGTRIELASGTQIVATLEALVDREWPQLAATIVALAAKEDAA